MSQPLINILIRVSRPMLFEKCMESIWQQTYKNWYCLLFPDGVDSYFASMKQVLHKDEEKQLYDGKAMLVRGHIDRIPFGYNLYLNHLKREVEEGWWMVLDDDDVFANEKVLENMVEYLTNEDELVICQMLRKGQPKPGNIYMDRKMIIKGRIGMPCFFLHAKHKDVDDFVATEDADYRFIKSASYKLRTKFVKIPVVDAGYRSHGESDSKNGFRYTSNDMI